MCDKAVCRSIYDPCHFDRDRDEEATVRRSKTLCALRKAIEDYKCDCDDVTDVLAVMARENWEKRVNNQ